MSFKSPNTHYGSDIVEGQPKKVSSDGVAGKFISPNGEGDARSAASPKPEFGFAGQGENTNRADHEKPSARHPGETKPNAINRKGHP